MKAFVLTSIFLIFAVPFAFAQQNDIPISNLIDAKQLLRDVEILSADDMEGRFVGSQGGVKARNYLVKRFKEIGLAEIGGKSLQPFPYSGRDKVEVQGANVFGMLKGTKHPDKYIVITAHYDHLGMRNGVIYNGADDDASGTSAIMALAKYFKNHLTENSLIFVAFDAEETGGTGSKKFVAEPPVAAESIVMNVNIDMIGQNDKNELYASGTYHYPSLKTYLEPIAKDARVKLILGHDRPEQGQDDWTFQSDHGSFHRKKIPFIYFGVEDHKDYHKPTDDYATLTKPFFVHGVETILTAIKAFDKNAEKIAAQKQGK